MGQFYNDPQVGQAFENLGAMFKPPTAQDYLYRAEAQATADKNARLNQIYKLGADPSTSQAVLDRLGVSGGLYQPNQSYYSVDQDNAQKDRTTAADNVRALLQTQADNATKLQQTGITTQGDLAKVRLGPVAEGASLPPIDPSMSAATGMPVNAGYTGVVKAGQGDSVLLPGGSVFNGVAPNQTPEQVQGGLIGALTRRNSALAQQFAVQGMVPKAQSDAGKPAADAALGLLTPDQEAAAITKANAPTGGSASVKTSNFRTSDGKLGQAYFEPNSKQWLIVGSNAPVPPNSISFEGNVTAPDINSLGKPTDKNTQDASFAVRGADALQRINALEDSGYKPSIAGYEMTNGVGASNLPVSIANTLAGKIDPQSQEFAQAGENFLNSILRPDTGAAFSQQEKQDYTRTFLPLPGDLPPVVAAKRQARDLAVAVTAGSARGQTEQLISYLQAHGLPIPPALMTHLRVGDTPSDAGAGTTVNPSAPSSGAPPGTGKDIPVPAPGGAVAPAHLDPGGAANQPTASPGTLPPNQIPGAATPAPVGNLLNSGGPQVPNVAPPSGHITRVETPEQARALPPGTKFMTPDGRLMVR